MSTREAIEAVFRGAVAACDARHAVSQALHDLALDGRRPGAAVPPPVVLAAVGKAAPAMAAGAVDALGVQISHGVVVAPDGTAVPDLAAAHAHLVVMRAAHPAPDARSEAAGRALLALAASVPPHGFLVVLLSGGASALAAVPRDGLALAEKVAQVQALVRRGAAIDELNRLRASLSAIKGGRLAAACAAPVITLVVSDVPGDDLAVVGSGPTWPPRRRAEARRPGEPARPMDDVIELVAGLGRLRSEAAVVARAGGWEVRERDAPLVGDTGKVARVVLDAAAALPEGGAWIAGGEWTVALPERPGRGGRAAQLALRVARELPDGVTVLAGASDGVDGTGPAAGAIVDGGTWARVAAAGIDPADALDRCDAGPALAAIGADLAGGPTGVNHADLVVVVRERRGRHGPP